jgi:hypothetical protein
MVFSKRVLGTQTRLQQLLALVGALAALGLRATSANSLSPSRSASSTYVSSRRTLLRQASANQMTLSSAVTDSSLLDRRISGSIVDAMPSPKIPAQFGARFSAVGGQLVGRLPGVWQGSYVGCESEVGQAESGFEHTQEGVGGGGVVEAVVVGLAVAGDDE